MQEDFLHFIYKNRLWQESSETLVDGRPFEIINTGLHNHDSGPDFFNAQIKIGDIVWAGNVEIHVNSSDWYKHHHNNDMSYNNVILHIVYNNDKDIILANGNKIPTWQIEFPHILYNRYSDFKISEKEIACENYIGIIDDLHITMWMEKMAIERIETKSEYVQDLLQKTNNNWEESFYISLARSFGFNTNSLPFEQMSLQTPLSIIHKCSDKIFQLEALFFGQSGILEKSICDDYSENLFNEYSFLKQKYSLNPIYASMWKNSRMRPNNSPQVRIAQFASLMQNFQEIFKKIVLNGIDANELLNIKTSEYWHTHYLFGKEVENANTNIGKQAINTILINTIIPYIYIYNKKTKTDFDAESIIEKLLKIPAENNRETRAFLSIPSIKAENAYDTQAIINLKKNYCDKKKCLNCNIGYKIMKSISKL